MEGFSNAIKLGDVSDFIAPSQACVVGLGATPSGAPKIDPKSIDGDIGVVPSARPSSLAAAAISGTAPVPRPSIAAADRNAPVKVTLNDCLACSGCVTSSETVLLEAQSASELDAALLRARGQDGDGEKKRKKTLVVVTLSQQSVASLAVSGKKRGKGTMTPSEAASALSWALREAGATAVVDEGEPRALSLLASAAEFCSVYAASPEGKASLRRFAPRSTGGSNGSEGEEGRAAAAAEAAARSANSAAAALGLGDVASAASSRLLPCLASACPGWVCYAEKNAASAALPHAASASSAQAVSGLLIKRALLAVARKKEMGETNGERGEQGDDDDDDDCGGVFHVSVMPCADKKLESLRDDLVVSPVSEDDEGERDGERERAGADGGTRSKSERPPGTDCVLTTIELSEWLRSRHGPDFDLSSCPRSPLDSLSMMLQGGLAASRAEAAATSQASTRARLAPSAGTSGGLAEFVFRYASSTLFGVEDLPPGPLPWKAGRNGDVREVVLEMWAPGKRKRLEGEAGPPVAGDADVSVESTAAVVLRASLHYGFRNIQTLISRIRSGSSHSLPHYVEVMACPSGCVNGGGQLRGVQVEATSSDGGGRTTTTIDGRTLASEVYSSLAEELRPEKSDWYSSTLSSARALAGVAWPRGKVEPAGALSARVRDRKAEAAASAERAEAAEASGRGSATAAASSAAVPVEMSVDW